MHGRYIGAEAKKKKKKKKNRVRKHLKKGFYSQGAASDQDDQDLHSLQEILVFLTKREEINYVYNLRFKQTPTKNSGPGSLLMQVLQKKVCRGKYEIPMD